MEDVLHRPPPATDAPSAPDWTGLVEEPIAEEAVRAWLTTPASGAVALFAGTVRESSPGHVGVQAITYQAYETVAVRQLSAIALAARAAWPALERVAIVHRHGSVPLGEASVVIGVAAPHREEAFAASRFCIDVLKQTVPVWKLEHAAQESSWAETGVDITDVATAAREWLDAHGTDRS